jgi:uncharacterized membrane protein YbhN (UPF0104 family)
LSRRLSALANRKLFIFILKLAVSSFSLYLIFRKADVRQVMRILGDIGVWYFLIASVLYIISIVVSTLRWKLLLPEKFVFGRLFSLYMIGAFFSSFLPGVIGGDVVKAYYLNKDAKKISLTLASIFMDRYLGYVALMLIGIFAFPFSLPYFGASAYKWLMPLIFAVFVAASILFFGLKLGKRFKVMSESYAYFSLLKTRQRVIVKAIFLSFIIQAMNFLMVITLALKMGEHISVLLLSVFLPIIITFTSLPISISGIGVREGSFVLLLGLIGIRPEIATSLSLAWFFSVFVGSAPGLAFYLLRDRTPAKE